MVFVKVERMVAEYKEEYKDLNRDRYKDQSMD
jgi:hypothetical protein